MNTRIILSNNFQLVLDDQLFETVEENNWFSDRYFSKYTFPASMELNDQQQTYFKFLTENDAVNYQTSFDCIFNKKGLSHDAKFEILKNIGPRIEFQVYYGLEEFPNFQTKLALLPLHKFDLVNETMFAHANTIVSQSYPNVDYNFPKVLTDQFSTEEEKWAFFEGAINNYANGAFLINEYEVSTDTQINRNIIQPCPYLLYLLKIGFLDRGYILAGDILDDPEFKKATVYSLNEYYYGLTQAPEINLLITSDQGTGTNDYFTLFSNSVTLTGGPGSYKIAGNAFIRAYNNQFAGFLQIIYKGETIGYWTGFNGVRYVLVDINIEVLPGESNPVLQVISEQEPYEDVPNGPNIDNATIIDVNVTQLTSYDSEGNAQPTLLFPEVIDLTKAVPDMTFGKLFEIVKNWKNYDLKIEGDTAYVNSIASRIGKTPKKDLTKYEVKFPPREFNQAKVYELKFTDIETEDYDFPSLLIKVDGIEQSPYTEDPDAEPLSIDAIALPLKFLGDSATAHGFLEDPSKLQLVLYNGLVNSLNSSQDPAALSITNIYTNHYQSWYAFLHKAIIYNWDFLTSDFEVQDLNERSTVQAYGRNHVVKSIKSKSLKNGVLLVDIQTYSIE